MLSGEQCHNVCVCVRGKVAEHDVTSFTHMMKQSIDCCLHPSFSPSERLVSERHELAAAPFFLGKVASETHNIYTKYKYKLTPVGDIGVCVRGGTKQENKCEAVKFTVVDVCMYSIKQN